MNSLQQLITRCYQLNRDSVPVSPKLLAGLGDNTLILNDFYIDHDEITPLCRFLTSNTTINSLEVLILNQTCAKTKRLRRLAAAKAGTHSGFHLQGGKILKAVNVFIARSQALRHLEIEGVSLSLPLLQGLGAAMSARQESCTLGFQQVLISNVSLGGEGLRALAPHFGRCLIQLLSLENCNLGDDTLPYLASIVRAQEAIQDKCFWNSTLRVYPERSRGEHAEGGGRGSRSHQVYSDGVNTGLLLLNLSRNKYTSVGSKGICKLLHANQWIIGLNLSNNRIDEEGVENILQCSLRPEAEACGALLCLHLRGNPGCSASLLEELSEHALQSMVNPVLAALPSHCAEVIIEWLRLQEDATCPRSAKASKRERRGERQRGSEFLRHAGEDPERGGSSKRKGGGHVVSVSPQSLHLEQEEVLSAATTEDEDDEEDEEDEERYHLRPSGRSNIEIVCDEELPSGQNYLQDPSVEGFIPPSPSEGIDGRPPSRNSIRPRHTDHELAAGAGAVELSLRAPRAASGGRTGSYAAPRSSSSRPVSARASRDRFSSSSSEKFARPSSASRSASARSGSRGAGRYTNPYAETTMSSRPARSAPSDRQSRRPSRSSADLMSRDAGAKVGAGKRKKPPFRPASGFAPLSSYEASTEAHTSYLSCTAVERDLSKSRDFLRRSRSSPTDFPEARGRGRQVTSSTRRRQSSIDLTRARQQRKRSSAQEVSNSALHTAETMVGEMGKIVMQELAKVVNSVSSDLQNISFQMKSLTESMSESVNMINMSRDNTFATYTDALHNGYASNIIEEEEERGHVDARELSHWNREHLEQLRVQQQAADEDANLSLLIEEGLRSKLIDVIHKVRVGESQVLA